jgi:hypothetical protein
MVVCHVARHRAQRQDDSQRTEVQHVHAEAVRHQRHQYDQCKNLEKNGVDNASQQGIDDRLDIKRKGIAIIDKWQKFTGNARSARNSRNSSDKSCDLFYTFAPSGLLIDVNGI